MNRNIFKFDFDKYTMVLARDLRNILNYGFHAPKMYERLWVNPLRIHQYIDRNEVRRITGIHRNKASGIVVDWTQIHKITPLEEQYRMKYCFDHWVKNQSWEDLGVIEFMKTTKSYSSWPIEKIQERFNTLDRAYNEAKKTGRLKTRKEIDPNAIREEGGILVHISNTGEPVFGGNGFHRLAIAKILKLNKIPVCLGIIDQNALDLLDELRQDLPDSGPA